MSDSTEPEVNNLPENNPESPAPAEGATGEKKKRDELTIIYENYKKEPDRYASVVRTKIAEYKRENNDVQLPKKWREFIINMVKETVENNPDLCRYLIDFAQELDDRYGATDMKDSSLFVSIIEGYPAAIGIKDMEKYYEKYVVSEASFDRFCNRAIEHVKAVKDGKFAKQLFDWLNTQGDSQRVATYILKLFDNEVVAKDVLNEQFFNNRNRVGERFAKDIDKFADNNKKLDFDYTGTAVWDNWTKVSGEWKKRNKKRVIKVFVAILCAAAVIAGALAGLSFWWNSIDNSSIAIEGRGIIYCVYGESPELEGYNVTYKKNSGEEVTIPVTADMLDYNTETIGQQTATITYNGKTLSVTIEISAADIDVPELLQSGNSVSWKSVEHATSYNLYVVSSATASADKEYATLTTTSYDFSGQSDLSGTFYVYVIAVSQSEKYNNSAMSQKIALTKLAAVSSVTYTDGSIVWSAVEGADHYMLTYNGTSVTDIKTTSYAVEISGDIVISVNAYSADDSVISSVSTEYSLHRLAAVTSAAYSETTNQGGSTVSRISWTAEEECYYIYSVDGGEYSSAQLAAYIDVSYLTEGVHSISIICYPMYSNHIQSVAVTYKFAINSNIEVSSSGEVSWSSIGSVYSVYIDGVLSRKDLSVTSISLANDNLSAGEHTISIVADGDIYGKTLTFTQLAVPELSVTDGSLTVSGATEYTVYTLNGTTYTSLDGVIEQIISAGTYSITVQNISSVTNVISSASATTTVTKLAVPTLSLNNGEIVSNVTSDLQYYEDGSVVNIEDLAAGTHTITAKAVRDDGNYISSEMSASITVTKLSAPTINYDSSTGELSYSGTVENGNGIKFYIDGVEYTGSVDNLINSLTEGSYEITARNIGDNTSYISSSYSNAVNILRTSATLKVTDNGGGIVSIVLSGMESGITYNVTVYFYDSEYNEIDSYTRTDQTDTLQRVSCNRGSLGFGYYVKVYVTFSSGGATYTLFTSEYVEISKP